MGSAWRFSTLIVYLSAYMLVACLAVCIATGVYYVAEVIEENSQKAKSLIRNCVYGTVGAHVILLIWDRQPFLCVLSGVAAQLCYLQLLTKSFPFISFGSPFAILSGVALFVNQLAWYLHFSDQYNYDTAEYALCFCLAVVWVVPIILMCSLASSDGVLPGAPGMSSSSSASSSKGQSQNALYGGSKKGFLLQLIHVVQVNTTPVVKTVFAYFGIRGKSKGRDHYT